METSRKEKKYVRGKTLTVVRIHFLLRKEVGLLLRGSGHWAALDGD